VGLARELLKGRVGGLEEAGLQKQVLRRVAGERELGEHHEGGALVARAGHALGDTPSVAVDVPDDGVELREGNPEKVGALGHASIIAGAGPKRPH
jgi:hypothetical protein